MEKGILIKNGIIITVIVATVFLSQQLYFKEVGKQVNTQAGNQLVVQWEKANSWFAANVYPRVAKEAAIRGEAVQEEVSEQKDNAVKSIWQNIKNYFAEKFSKLSGTKVE